MPKVTEETIFDQCFQNINISVIIVSNYVIMPRLPDICKQHSNVTLGFTIWKICVQYSFL